MRCLRARSLLLAVLFTATVRSSRGDTTYTAPTGGTFTNAAVWNFGAGSFGTWGIPASDAGLVLNLQTFGTTALGAVNDLNLTLNRLNLVGSNSGGTSLSASLGGTLAFTGAAQINLLGSSTTSTTLSAPVVLGSGATGLTFDGAGASAVLVTGLISSNTGTGAPLTIATDARHPQFGVVALFGVNTFAGGVVLNSGTLTLANSRALGDRSSVLTVNGGYISGGNISNNVILNSTPGLFFNGTPTYRGVLSGAGGLNVRATAAAASSTLNLAGIDTFTGATVVGSSILPAAPVDGAGGLNLTGAVGSIMNTSGITVRDGATLNLRFDGGSSASSTRVATDTVTGTAITVQSGFVQAVGNAGMAKQSLGTVTAGGITTLAALTNGAGTGTAGAATELTVGNLVRGTGATVLFQGPNLGGTPVGPGVAAAQGNVILTQINGTTPGTALVGGGGAAGSTTMSILPWALGDTSNSSTLYNGGSGLVTYDTNGVRLLNTTTEYNTGNNLNTAGSTDNVRITAAPTALSAAKTVNSLFFGTTGLTQSGAFNLTVTSGALLSNVAAATISSPVLFGSGGTGEAIVSVADALAGTTNSLTLSGGFTAASLVKSGHGDLTISTVNPTISGGITINGGEISVDAVSRLGLSGVNGITVNGSSQAANRAGLTFTHSGSPAQTLGSSTAVPIVVNAGTVSISTTGTAANTVLNVDSVISGSGGVTYNNANANGTIVVGGTNTYTGPTFITGSGTVQISSDANFGSSTDPNASFLNLGGGTLKLTGNWTSARAINLSGNITLDNGANNATLSGVITSGGPFTLTKSGTGTLTIDSGTASGLDSSYSATVAINAGTLKITGTGALNSASITLSSTGTLDFGGATSIDSTTAGAWRSVNQLAGVAGSSIIMGASAGAPVDLRVNSSTTVVSSVISGFGKLVKTGTLALTLGGANTFTGGVEVWGGQLAVNADNQLGNASNGITLEGGLLNTTATLTTSRAITLGATPQPVISASAAVVTLANGINANTGSTLTLNGAISGPGGVNMGGPGTVVLGTANSYQGDTQVSAGTLNFTANNQLGAASSRIRLNGGTLGDINNTGTVTVNRPVIVTGTTSSTINVINLGTLQLTGALVGNPSAAQPLIKTGAGTLSLSGDNNAFFGTLQVNGSGVALTSTGQMRRGSISLNAAGTTLTMSGLTRELGSVSLSADSTLALGTSGSLTTGFNNANMTWAGNITASTGGSVFKVGTGTITYQSAASSFNGGFHVLSGQSGVTTISGSGVLPPQSALTLGAWGSTSNKGPVLRLDNTTTNASNRIDNFQVIHSNAGEIVFSTNTVSLSFETVGALLGAGQTHVTMTTGGILEFGGAPGLQRIHKGTFLFRAGNATMGTNTATTTIANLMFSGSLTTQLVGGGGGAASTTISILPYAVGGITTSDTGSNFVTYDNTTGVRVLNTTTEVQSSLTAASATENVRTANPSLTTTSLSSDRTVNALNISGSADMTRIQSSTGTEKLTLTSGLLLNAVNNVWNTDTAAPYARVLGVHTAELQTGDAGTGPNSRELNVFTTGGDLLLGSKISTSGGLTKSGAANLYLTNTSNSYTGPTTINAGSLVVDNFAVLGGSATLQMGGGFLKYRGGDATLTQSVLAAGGEASNPNGGSAGFHIVSGTTLTVPTGAISGFGGVLKDGTGVLKLTGTQNYSGATIINGGALAIDGAAALGTNSRLIFGTGLSTAGGQTLRFDANNITLTQDIITNTSDATIPMGFDTNGNNATLAGTILSTTSTRGLIKFGAGNLTLTATEMYTGATGIYGGTLTLSGANGSIASSTGTGGFNTAAAFAGNIYIAPGAALVLDNAAANHNNRLPDVWDTPFGSGNAAGGALVLAGGEFSLLSHSSTLTQERTNQFNISHGTITLKNNGGGAQLISGRLTPVSAGTSAGLIRGDNLGGTPGAGSTNWFVTDLGSGGVQLNGAGGAEGTPFVNTLLGFAAATSATGTGSDLVTYAADVGFRPLTAGEYQSTLPANNFDPNRAPNLGLTTALTVNQTSAASAVKLGTGGSITGSGTLALFASTVLATADASLSTPMLSARIAGSNAHLAFLTSGSSTTLTVDSVIATGNSGQLIKYGEGTLLLNQRALNQSPAVVAQGTLKLGANGVVNPLQSLQISRGASFDLNGADRTIGVLTATQNVGSYQLGQVQDGTVALGANRLTLYSSNSTLWTGGITSTANTGGLTKALNSSGNSTFTQPLTYSGSTVLRGGSFELAGMGTLLASSSIELRGGSLVFTNTDDNATTTGYIANRISTSVPITWAGGSIGFIENVNAPGNHQLGATTLAGQGNLTITQTSVTAPSTTTFANLIRGDSVTSGVKNNTGTLTISATNLGLAQSPTGNARIFATQINGDVPQNALVGGGGAVGTTTQSILPWAWSSTAGSFITYGADGFRPLAASEHVNSLATSTANDNALVSAATTLTAAASANSLIYANAAPLGGAFDLTLTSGALAATSITTIGVNTKALLTGAGNTRELVVNSVNNLTLNYNVTTSGGVTKFGAGTLTLGGTNTFSGGLTINDGTVNFSNDNQLGAAGSSIRFGGTVVSVAALAYTGSSPLAFNRPVETAGFGSLNGVANVRWQLNQPISGAGGIRLTTGNAVFELNAANTYTGPTVINSAIVYATGDGSFGSTAGGGAEILFGGTIVQRSDWSTSRLIHAQTGGILHTNGFTTTWSGQFIGTGTTIAKVGTGSLVLPEAMPFAGTLSVNAGSLVLQGRGSLAVATVSGSAGATVLLDDTGTHFSDRLNDIGTTTLNAANLTLQGSSTMTTEEVISTLSIGSGVSTVTLTPGSGQAAILRVATSVSVTGSGGVLFRGTNLGVNTPGSASTASIVLTHPASQNQVSSVNNAVILTGGLAPAGNPSIGIIKGGFGDTSATGLGTQLVTYDMDKGVRLLNPDTEYTSTLADGSIVTDNIKLDNTARNLTSTSTIANALWLKDGGSITGGGTLGLTSGNVLVTGTGNSITGIISAAPNVVAIGGPGDVTFNTANGINTTGGLAKLGEGTLTLTQANTYTGATWLHSGTLALGHAAALSSSALRFLGGELRNSSTGLLSISNALTLDGTMRISGTQDITFSGTVSLNNATREINTTNTGITTLSGVISSSTPNVSYGLTKTGTGVLVLSGTANTYDGPTTVSAGELSLTNTGGSATGTGSIVVEAGGTLSGTGFATTGPGQGIQINGTLSIGNVTGTRGALSLTTNSLGSGFSVGATGKMTFGLFSGAGAGDNTGIPTASDLLILSTSAINLNAAAQIVLENPNNLSAWAIGDKWQLWQIGGSPVITGGIAYTNIFAPWFVFSDRSFSFDANTGVLSIVAGVPEPSRALLVLLGLGSALLRRRRV